MSGSNLGASWAAVGGLTAFSWGHAPLLFARSHHEPGGSRALRRWRALGRDSPGFRNLCSLCNVNHGYAWVNRICIYLQAMTCMGDHT